MQNLLEKDNNVQMSNVNQLNVNHEQHKNQTGYGIASDIKKELYLQYL